MEKQILLSRLQQIVNDGGSATETEKSELRSLVNSDREIKIAYTKMVDAKVAAEVQAEAKRRNPRLQFGSIDREEARRRSGQSYRDAYGFQLGEDD